MPGAADDPRGPRAQAASLLDEVSRESVPLRDLLTDAGLPAGVQRQAADAFDAVGEVRRHVHSAVQQLDSLAGNDTFAPAGRDRLIRERKAITAVALKEVDARSSVAVKLLEAGLTDAAQPEFPADADRAEARDELKLLLDASDDPATTVRELVAGSDQRLAALAAGTFAASYLRSRGVDEATIAATRTFTAQAALSSGDPTREAAARALTKLDDLRKLRLKALNAANFAIEWNT
jgi:hypothetical protein